MDESDTEDEDWKADDDDDDDDNDGLESEDEVDSFRCEVIEVLEESDSSPEAADDDPVEIQIEEEEEDEKNKGEQIPCFNHSCRRLFSSELAYHQHLSTTHFSARLLQEIESCQPKQQTKHSGKTFILCPECPFKSSKMYQLISHFGIKHKVRKMLAHHENLLKELGTGRSVPKTSSPAQSTSSGFPLKQLNKDAIKPPQISIDSDSDKDSIIEVELHSCLFCGKNLYDETGLAEHIARHHIATGLQRRLLGQGWSEGGSCPECGEVEDVLVHWGVEHGHVNRIMQRWKEGEGHRVNMSQDQKAVVSWCKQKTEDCVRVNVMNQTWREEVETEDIWEGTVASDLEFIEDSNTENDPLKDDNEEDYSSARNVSDGLASDDGTEVRSKESNANVELDKKCVNSAGNIKMSSRVSGEDVGNEVQQKPTENANVEDNIENNNSDGVDDHKANSIDDVDIILEKVVVNEEKHDVITLTDDELDDKDAKTDTQVDGEELPTTKSCWNATSDDKEEPTEESGANDDEGREVICLEESTNNNPSPAAEEFKHSLVRSIEQMIGRPIQTSTSPDAHQAEAPPSGVLPIISRCKDFPDDEPLPLPCKPPQTVNFPGSFIKREIKPNLPSTEITRWDTHGSSSNIPTEPPQKENSDLT